MVISPFQNSVSVDVIEWKLKWQCILLFQAAVENHEPNGKKIKPDEVTKKEIDGAKGKAEAKSSGDANQKQNNDSSKPPEPPKDYIHVRARRGQATDSHSLAERVRINAQILYIFRLLLSNLI